MKAKAESHMTGFRITFPNTTRYGLMLQNYRARRPRNIDGTSVYTRNVDEECAIRGVLAVGNGRYLSREAMLDYRKGSIRVERDETHQKTSEDRAPTHPRLF